MKPVAKNKKAYFDYQIVDDLSAGLVLLGPEIKAIRNGRVNITGSYIKPFTADNRAELWWVGSNFMVTDGDATRSKKLLLHRAEIERLVGKLTSKGYTILPLELYLQRGRAKLKIGLGSRKKDYDHRQEIRARDLDRDISREFREKQKGS